MAYIKTRLAKLHPSSNQCWAQKTWQCR